MKGQRRILQHSALGDRQLPPPVGLIAVVVLTLCLGFATVRPAVAKTDQPAPPPIPLRLKGAPARSLAVAQSPDSESAEAATRGTRVTQVPQLARELVAAVNVLRRSHKLPVLVLSPRLQRAGEGHALALARSGQFTHSWPDGRPFGTWILGFYPAARFRYWRVGENLVWAAPTLTAEQAMEDWLASPKHRQVLLTPAWRQLGIGVVDAVAAPGAYGGSHVTVAAAEFGVRR
jgi:uncharacterized protein YkwD